VSIDRTRADQLGLTEKQVADNLLISLAGKALHEGMIVSVEMEMQSPQGEKES
jgi:hypothetical protein